MEPLEPNEDNFEAQPAYSPGERRLSSLMLLTAIFCLSMGLLVPVFYEFAQMVSEDGLDNFKGEPYASGNQFMPRNVSQMFSDFAVGTSRTWIGMMLGACMALVASKYPWMLSNVFVPEAEWLPLARGLAVPIALLMVIMVPVVQGPNEETRNRLNNVVHLFWVQFLVVAYLSAELLALQSLRLSETEKRLRWAFFWLCIVFGVGFLLVDLFNDFVWRSDSQWICCGDDWVIATAEEREEFVRKGLGRLFGDQTVLDMLSGRYVLRDTSSGWARYLRFTGYLLECLMLVSLLGSHTVVYLFCEERNLRFPARPDGHMWARKATALVK